MHIGVSMFHTEDTIGPDELARAVEARGLSSLFVPDHTHMPVDHSPYPAGGPLPDAYRHVLDPFVVLAAAASATDGIELGTAVCLVAQRDPLVLAKQVASIDHLAHGRFLLGVGYGWNRQETENHGVAWKDRRAVVRERLEAMRALWSQEVASADSTHVRFTASWSWPKPDSGGPPVLLGASLGPRTLSDLVAVADGWIPNGGRAVAEGTPLLLAAWREAGRAGRPRIHAYGSRADLANLRRLAALDLDGVTLRLPPGSRAEVVPVLDEYARLAEALRAAPKQEP